MRGEVSFFSSRWVQLSISGGLLALLLWSVDLQHLFRQLLTARADWVVVAFLGYVAGQVLSAYKWRLLAQPLGFRQPFRHFLVSYFAGMYLNLFSLSTLLGDMGRGLLLVTHRGELGSALQSVVADRASGAVMLLWVGTAGFLLYGSVALPAGVSYGMLLLTLCTAIGWRILPAVLRWHGLPLRRGWDWLSHLVMPYLQEGRVVRRACALALVLHLSQIGLQALLAHALGLAIPFGYLLAIVPVITLLSFLPLSFSGVGIREGGYVLFLAPVGIGTEDALALSLLWTSIMFAAGVVGGICLLVSPPIRTALRSQNTRHWQYAERDHPPGP
ncbi:MAG: flippase-like domain-containing protein [Candidatus Binatia bacterium]|nr:flippase-like domain-containing protein [Candidatus Binatia bacterium]